MTDWLSASAVLIAGIVVGFMFLYGMKRRHKGSDLERADLEAKRDALLAQLRQETAPEERARLESEAADVLRKLDRAIVGAGAPAPAAAGETPAATHAALKGFLWGAASVGILAGIGWFVMQSSRPKGEVPPVATDTALAELEQRVQQNPDNLALRNDLAKAYLDRDNLNGVAEQTQYVLQRAPDDARALTYQGIVHIAARQPEAAAALLQRATQSDPNLIDAWVGLAFLHAQSGNFDRAETAIAEAKRRHPEEAARLDELMSRLRAPQQPPAAAAPAQGEGVQITLNADGAKTYPQTAIIFIIARPAGMTSGPPAAVKRVALGTFPITIALTAADSMMGQPLPPKMRIEARIDTDGDPMTRDPKDPQGVVDRVAGGQSISLTLK